MKKEDLLRQGKRLEQSCSGRHRTYDETLKPDDEYFEEKRASMLQLNYTNQEIKETMNGPKIQEYHKDLDKQRTCRKEFIDRVMFLAKSHTRDRNTPDADAMLRLTRLGRILNLDWETMGNTAVLHLTHAFAYWYAQCNRESNRQARFGHRATMVPRVGLNEGYQPREVNMGKATFASQIEKAGWIKRPKQCKEFDEQCPVHTLNNVGNFPKYEMRTLAAIAKLFGFMGADDIDECGKNIYHHVFTAMKYCQLFGEIALRAFEPNSEPLAGNNRDALTRKISGGYQPRGWTALHILCHGSDCLLLTRKVIELMLARDIVKIRDFAIENDQVRVF